MTLSELREMEKKATGDDAPHHAWQQFEAALVAWWINEGRALAENGERLNALVALMLSRNVHLQYYDRTHEIPGPTFALSDQNTGETLGYGPTVRAALDAAMKERPSE